MPVAGHAGPLAPVLEACLRKDPAQRSTATELGRLLDDVAAGRVATSQGAPTVAASVPTASLSGVLEATVPPASAPPPAPTTPPAPIARQPPARPGTRPWLLGLAAAVVLIVLVAVGLARAGGNGADETGASSGATSGARPGSSTTSAAAKAPTSAGSRSGSATPAPEAATGAAALSRHVDPEAGYSVGYPVGWQVRRLDGTRTDFIDPVTGTYLRVDWTKKPADPLEAWQRSSKAFGSSHEGYEEIRVEEAQFQGFPGAIWEYRYDEGGGRLHATNLTFVTSEERAYALNFQTADSRWDATGDLRKQIEGSFQVTAPPKGKGDDKDDKDD